MDREPFPNKLPPETGAAHLELAVFVALNAHKGQLDKGGHPYILHPLAVMNGVSTLEEKIVALLHDVVEDSDMTLERLAELGFAPVIVAAVDGMTRREGESYDEFIARAAAHPLSKAVKIADIRENMKLDRIGNHGPDDRGRLEKYKQALVRLAGPDGG